MAKIEGGSVIIETDWPALKSQVDNRNINFKYEEDSTAYEIFAIDGQYFYTTIIYKSGQAPQNQALYDIYRVDFETNYKNRITDFNSTQPTFITNRDGYSIVLKDGNAATTNDGYGIAVIGYDGNNYRMLRSDTSGRQILVGAGIAGSPLGGIISIQGISGGTAVPISSSGNFTVVQPIASNLNATVIGTITANIGITNGLALDTSVNGLLVSQGSTTSGQKGTLALASVTAAAPSYTTTQTSPLSLTTAGALRTDSSSTIQPISGTITANQGISPWSQNITQFGSNNISTGIGSSGIGIPRVTISNDSNILATQSGIWTVQPGNTANTVPWLTTINQGNNSASVKPASIAAITTDPALVVAISPNNSINIAQADITNSATLNSLNAQAIISLAGYKSAGMQLLAGTLIGTIIPEISFDNGTTWVGTFFDDPTTGNKSSNIIFSSNNIAAARTIVGAGGASNIRIRVSAFTSGTAICNIRASNINDPSVLFAGSPNSTVQPPVASQIAGWDIAGVLRTPSVKAGNTAATTSDQPLVVILSPNQQAIPVSTNPATSVPNIAAGYVTTSAITKTAVIASTYIEQTTNAQRSFKSASASDTALGVGARTIILTYYDQTLSGPFTEIIALNGTVAVNTISASIAYIESIMVATAGTSLSNVGIISMFTAIAGGGSTMATINAAENRTLWGNHYVTVGKICYITGLSGHNTNTSNGSVLTLTSYNPTSANSIESQISDFVRVGGGTSQPVRVYNQLIKVVGPSRVKLYETCEGTATITTRAAFDYYDQ